MPVKINYNLAALSAAEQLWLARRYGQGVSQDIAAPRAKLSHNLYVDMELGRRPLTGPLRALAARAGGLTLPQQLRLARRRSRRQLAPLAKAIWVSRVTYLAMERRADPRLIAFWRDRGFRDFTLVR